MPDPIRYWTLSEIAPVLGVTPARASTIWRRGGAPGPDAYLGRQMPGWLPASVAAWRESRAARGLRPEVERFFDGQEFVPGERSEADRTLLTASGAVRGCQHEPVRYLDGPGMAHAFGCSLRAIHAARNRGAVPPPDAIFGSYPGLRGETVAAWQESGQCPRPSAGQRLYFVPGRIYALDGDALDPGVDPRWVPVDAVPDWTAYRSMVAAVSL